MIRNFLIRFKDLLGILLGPTLAILCWSLFGMDEASEKLLGVMIWVASWWIASPIPLAVTSLWGPTLAVTLGVATPKEAYPPFAHPLIFLFMGGFFLAKGLSRQKLDHYLAKKVLGHKLAQKSNLHTLTFLCLIGLFLSMWISNTAATAILYPLAMGILASNEDEKSLEVPLLAIAYSCSLGGVLTPIGSPPNVIALGFLKETKGIDISFFEWMILAIPVIALSFVLLFFLLRHYLKNHQVVVKLQELDPKLGRAQKFTIAVFFLAIILWTLPGLSKIILGSKAELTIWIKSHLSESVVALFCSALLFIPVFKEQDKLVPALTWKEAQSIDWQALLLFGGGLSLGKMMLSTGLSEEIAKVVLELLSNHTFSFIFTLTYFMIFFTEFTSNTASANLFIPIVIAACDKIGFSATYPTLAIAFAANMAFMLPVATPPNAIIFGSGKVRMWTMIKKGFFLNIIIGFLIICYFTAMTNFLG